MPRARRSGGYMSAAAVRARAGSSPARPDEREPGDHERRGVDLAAERGRQAAADPGEAAAGEHRDPAEAVHQAPGRKRGERAGGEEDRRPEAEDPLDAGDEHERHRADRDRELDHAGERRQRRREQDRVAADRELLHGTSLREHRGEALTEGRRAAARRVADVGAAEPRVREPADGITRRPRASSPRNGAASSISRRVGGRFDRSVPGCVGTRFQSRTSSASPSSASARWTIVAVASAGPAPVSWRSDVSGIPETRVPR